MKETKYPNLKVVVASAGTGKTTWLARRYLELLEHHRPSQVAAVTFTRRAAGELQRRILEGLEQGGFYGWQAPAGVHERRRELASEVAAAPIGTIHMLAAEHLRLAARLVGIDPHFEVLEPAVARGWFEEALRSEALALGWDLEALSPEQEQALKDALALYEELGRSVGEPRKAGAPELELALRLFQGALRRYRTRLNGRKLSPAELEHRWLMVLRHPAARQRIAERHPVVLLDELQDTSALQLEAVRLLLEAGVQVEAVGDPKQSIYGFREADVAGFLRLAQRAGEREYLDTSWRHARRVQGLLNRLVRAERSWSPTKAGKKRDAEVVRAWPDWASRPVKAAREEEGGVEFVIFTAKRVSEARAREAEWVAARLVAAQAEEGIPWGEMMVLLRGRGSLQDLVPALQERGVPYVVESGRGLYEVPEVRELALALAFFAGGADRVVQMGFLTGPFVGLSPEEAARALEDPPVELAEWVAMRRDRAARMSPSEFLRSLMDEPPFRGEASFWDRLDPASVDTVLLVLSALSGTRSLEEAHERIRWLQGTAGDAGSLVRPEEGAVRLMTTHAAKGLEARMVVVFDTGRRPQEEKARLHVTPEGEVLPGAPEAGRGSPEEEAAEERRLLYVALSRAADRLVITGSQGGSSPAGWLKVLTELWGLEPDAVNPDPPQSSRAAVAVARPPEPVGREPIAARPHVLSPTALAERERLFEGEDDGALEVARVVGVLVHAGIERGWRLEALDRLLPGEQIFRELPEELAPEVRERVRRALAGYWSLVESGRIPAPEERELDLAEVPLVVRQGAVVWEGVVDRLYRVGERWYLEDYKTGSGEHPEVYYPQLALYREAVRETLGNVPLEIRLVFLGGERPEVVVLDEEALARGLAEVVRASAA